MLSREALRLAAQSVPAVLVDSATLIELLDAAERAPAKSKGARTPRQADPEDERCARWLLDALLKSKPNAKQPNIGAWADDVRLMREQDKRNHKEICALFAWARTDSFWRLNILCPKKLREKWDQLELKRGAAAAMPARESVDDRNTRLRAAFLGAPAAPTCLQLEG